MVNFQPVDVDMQVIDVKGAVAECLSLYEKFAVYSGVRYAVPDGTLSPNVVSHVEIVVGQERVFVEVRTNDRCDIWQAAIQIGSVKLIVIQLHAYSLISSVVTRLTQQLTIKHLKLQQEIAWQKSFKKADELLAQIDGLVEARKKAGLL